MTTRVSLAVLAFGAAAPAAAQAATTTIGSNLKAKAKATVAESAPVDSAYWNVKLASGGQVTSPVKGELSVVRLKGRVDRSKTTSKPPNVVLHFQVLRPRPNGRVKAIVTTANLRLPFGGSADRVTKYRLQRLPARICVQPGDYVALSTSGGFGSGYPDGASFRMFGAVPGSAFKGFTGAGRDMDGDVFTGRERADRELLARATIATGADARPSCR